jgi:hypothetical protein
MIQTLLATRYLTPLREGGSLPAIVEADDGELYVMKFVGAGQGAKALIAELVAGEIGRALGLAIPEIVLLTLDPQLGRTEGDPEIQALLAASAGINLGLRYLPKAFAFSPLLRPPPDRGLASAIVWFDAYITNVDRTPRNTNILLWNGALWLIDHGAALYFHHRPAGPEGYLDQAANPFSLIKHHVLLPLANALPEADIVLRERLTPPVIHQVVADIPASWLRADGPDTDPEVMRDFYRAYLWRRLQASDAFVEEAIRAQH